MNKFEQYKLGKEAQSKDLALRADRNIKLAEGMKSNRDYAEKIGDFGNRLHIWNIEQGGYVPASQIQNPRIQNRPRYTQDQVYQKLVGVRENLSDIGQRSGLTFSGLLQVADSVIRGLMKRVEDRQMTEKEYASLLAAPRSAVYSQILKETYEAHKNALRKVGYGERIFMRDEDFAKLSEAKRKSARTLEQVFNIDLSRDYPQVERKYTLQDLKGMHPVFAKRLLILGKVEP
ncbi:MAG TPA: hypothetical protein VJJ82_00395 [Candidatus Nanoarchaeia archaeon]|nr:hypothetical protein [Candidatus Nanoarchaeia archaeon]